MTNKISEIEEFHDNESEGYIKAIVYAYIRARRLKSPQDIKKAISNITTRCSNIMREHDYKKPEFDEAMPHYFSEATFWMYREVLRLCPDEGKYPKAVSGLSVQLPMKHFVHVSLDNKAQVAYVKDEKFGKADRQMRQKFGRYLKANVMQDALDHEIEAVVCEYRAKYMVEDWEVKFTTTSEEAVWVYDNGPDSCMSHDISDYDTAGIHPCAVYATDSCCVAYITDPNDDSRVTGRAVINKKAKQWTIIYGDSAILEEKLEALDYSEGGLDGCQLRKIQIGDSYDYVMPYLDGDCNLVEDEGDHFLVSHQGGVCGNQTNGTLHAEDREWCSDCEDYYPQDEVSPVWNGNAVCNNCVSSNYTSACTDVSDGVGINEEMVEDNCVVDVTYADGNTHAFEENTAQGNCECVEGEYYTPDAVFEDEILEQYFVIGDHGPWQMMDQYGEVQTVSMETLKERVTHFNGKSLVPLMEADPEWDELFNAEGDNTLPCDVFELSALLKPWATGMIERTLCMHKLKPDLSRGIVAIDIEARKSARYVADLFDCDPREFIRDELFRMWKRAVDVKWDLNLRHAKNEYAGPPTKAQIVAHLMLQVRPSQKDLNLLESLISTGTPILATTGWKERLTDYDHKKLAYSVKAKNLASLALMTEWVG